MKKLIIAVILLTVATVAHAGWGDDWRRGYQEGYKRNSLEIAPIAPIAPIPSINSDNQYRDGVIAGYEARNERNNRYGW